MPWSYYVNTGKSNNKMHSAYQCPRHNGRARGCRQLKKESLLGNRKMEQLGFQIQMVPNLTMFRLMVSQCYDGVKVICIQ